MKQEDGIQEESCWVRQKQSIAKQDQVLDGAHDVPKHDGWFG